VLRRLLLLSAVVGALLLWLEGRSSSFDTVPFPGPGLTDKLLADIGSRGGYYLRLDVPKADERLAMGPETIRCSLDVTLSPPKGSPIHSSIGSFFRYAAFGFAKLQSYQSSTGRWDLAPGRYTIEIASTGSCSEVATRGGALTLAQEITRPTETYLWNIFRHYMGVICLSGGLFGLIVVEVTTGLTKRSNQPLTGA
jgi:hypothetical protein